MLCRQGILDIEGPGAQRWKRGALGVSLVALCAIIFAPVTGYQQRPCLVDETPEAGLCGSGWSHANLIAFSALAPLGWSTFLGVLVMICSCGEGGFIGRLLSHPLWVPMARLSYGAYLVHPIVITFMTFSTVQSLRWDPVWFVTTYVSICTISFLVTGFLSLLVESPITVAIKEITNRGSKSPAVSIELPSTERTALVIGNRDRSL